VTAPRPLNLAAAVVSAIAGDGMTPSVVGSAQGRAGPAASLYTVLPVTGGKVKLSTASIAGGSIDHGGGLDFAGKVGATPAAAWTLRARSVRPRRI